MVNLMSTFIMNLLQKSRR